MFKMNSKKQGALHFEIIFFKGKNRKLRRNCVVEGAKLTLRLLFCETRN